MTRPVALADGTVARQGIGAPTCPPPNAGGGARDASDRHHVTDRSRGASVPRIRNFAFDCADPYALAVFWSAVMREPIDADCAPGDEEVGIRLATSQALFFQRVAEPKAVKNRAHICLEPDETRDADVDRIIALGATLLEDHRRPDGSGWVVLADPEGNEFCVLRGPVDRRSHP
jgi:predicted enzyme related to lactoylglutathione lyase